MLLNKNQINNLEREDCNVRGIYNKYFKKSMSERQFRNKYREDLKEFKNEFGLGSWGGVLYVNTHINDVIDMLKEYRTLNGLARELGMSCTWLRNVLESNNIIFDNLRQRNGNLYEKWKSMSLFSKDEFTSIESYLYGYYLGDGRTSKDSSGKLSAIYLNVYDERDYHIFKKLVNFLGISSFLKKVFDGDNFIGYVFGVTSDSAIDELVNLNMIETPKYNLDLSGRDDLYDILNMKMVFRGLVDSDGHLPERGGWILGLTNKSIIDWLCEWLDINNIEYNRRFQSYKKDNWKDSYKVYIHSTDDGVGKLLSMGLYDEYPDLVSYRKKKTSVGRMHKTY